MNNGVLDVLGVKESMPERNVLREHGFGIVVVLFVCDWNAETNEWESRLLQIAKARKLYWDARKDTPRVDTRPLTLSRILRLAMMCDGMEIRIDVVVFVSTTTTFELWQTLGEIDAF